MNLKKINWHDSPIHKLTFSETDFSIEFSEFGTEENYILSAKSADSIEVETEEQIDLGASDIGSLKYENEILSIAVLGCQKGFMIITINGGIIELKEVN